MDFRKWIFTCLALLALAVTSGCASVVREDAYPPRIETTKPAAVSATAVHEAAPSIDHREQHREPASESKNSGSGINFFLELGKSKYEKPPCSLWHHECGGYETEWGMEPTMFRLGVEYSGLRLSYFDLGKYSIKANACDDEGFVLHGGGSNCPTDTDWYFSSGSMRGFALSYRYRFLGIWVIDNFFIEGGLAKFRQHFKIEKDDGFSYQERLWGPGYLLGFGIEGKHLSLGYYVYNTKIGGKFEDCMTPSGTGGAHVFTIEFKF